MISTNSVIQGALEGFITIKKARVDLVARMEDKVQLEKVLNRLEKKRLHILKYSKTAPFQRSWDKISYIFGANFAILFAYFIGKTPHTFVYIFATFVMLLLLSHRYYTYWHASYHMYLIDFCYLGNFALLYLINFAP